METPPIYKKKIKNIMADLNLNFNDNLDAFARLRVSNPITIFDSKQIHDNAPLFWDDQQVSGGGTSSTHLQNEACSRMAVGNLTAGKRVRQTFRRFEYQTGKSQLINLTATFGAAATGIIREAGQHDDNNGIFFRQNASGFFVGIRGKMSGAPVDNVVHQTNAALSTDGVSTWNIDKMDGTGASGITLDFTKSQIFFFDYEWLGVGTVALGVFVDRKPYYIHYFNHANNLAGVYMSTPNNPLRYSIENDGTGGVASFDHICATVITEGGRDESGIKKGIVRDVYKVGLTTLSNTNLYPIIGIRLKSTNLGAAIDLIHSHLMATSTADYSWSIILNPTLSGTALSWISKTNSSVEYCFPTGATTLVEDTGEVLDCGLGSDTNQAKGGTETTVLSDLKLGAKIDGTADQVFLCARNLSAGIELYYGTLTFKE